MTLVDKFNPHFRQLLRENFSEADWNEFIQTLSLELQGRITATPDEELPKLKHQIVYLGELRNVFAAVFQHKGK